MTCAIYFAWRVTNLKAIYAQEKIDILTAQNDLHTQNMKAIDSMIAEQKKNRLITSQISEQIQSLKEGKTHDEEYYKIANSIADRYNSSLQ